MAKCRKCHRTLTDPKSVARGYGRRCAAKVAAAAAAAVATFKPAQVVKALELIASGEIRPSGLDSFYRVRDYRVDSTLCTCKAGQHGRTCYHLIAARVLDSVQAA